MTGTHHPALAARGRWLLLAAIALGLAADAFAEEAPRRERGGAAVLRVFKPVVADVARSTVRVVSVRSEEGGSPSELALGVIVSSDGFIVTKATQMQREV